VFFSSPLRTRAAWMGQMRSGGPAALRSALLLFGVYGFSVAEKGVILCKWGVDYFGVGWAAGVSGRWHGTYFRGFGVFGANTRVG
jgi:hypothetical protein